jgi:ACT domain-containing protein
MRIHADLQLKDVPGTLVKALAPIAEYGGNIVGIMHSRDRVVSGRITVSLIFDMEDEKPLKMLIDEWNRREVYIARIEEKEIGVKEQFLVTGKQAADVNDIIRKLSNLEGITISDMKMLSGGKSISALITVEIKEEEKLDELEKTLEPFSGKILVVRGV